MKARAHPATSTSAMPRCSPPAASTQRPLTTSSAPTAPSPNAAVEDSAKRNEAGRAPASFLLAEERIIACQWESLFIYFKIDPEGVNFEVDKYKGLLKS